MGRQKRVWDTGNDKSTHLKRTKTPFRETRVEQDNWLEGLSIAQADFSSQYRLGRFIAAGGFGRVHLLESYNHTRPMVCKVLPKTRSGRASLSAQKAYREHVVMVRCIAFLLK